MTKKQTAPYGDLERVFHEPNRLAIVSHLAGAAEGVPFTDLRDALALTDGNLSRHLKTLADAHVVRIEKTFVAARPRTTVYLTDRGRDDFLHYLEALEAVLREAAAATGKAGRRLLKRFGRAALDAT